MPFIASVTVLGAGRAVRRVTLASAASACRTSCR